jgi:hypothetical protein
MENNSAPPKPTRAMILKRFQRWAYKREVDGYTVGTTERQFQFENAVRSWKACGYPLVELELVFNVTMVQIIAAVEKVEEEARRD